MAYKYLYIDDTKNDIEQGTINGLQDGNEIEVDFKFPENWETQITDLIASMPNYNGLILDLRLNDNPNDKGKFAQYRGSSIAQELRTLSKENLIENDFPIILISANNNMERSFDQTSLDLFDIWISKDTIGNEFNGLTYQAFRDKLKWLADGYSFLNQSDKTIAAILNLPDKVILDFRFIDQFNKLVEKPIVHVIARFLTKEVIARPTFLIDEGHLATRLGIDMASEDWLPFREKCLKNSLYTGAFFSYYPRWWMSLVEEFWQSMISKDFSLRNTSAAKKVELLIKQTGFTKLIPIKKNDKSKSDSFWVLCKATHLPIDTIDGFIIADQDDNYAWQETEYISIAEALRPTKDFKVSALEKPRLNKIKILFERNEQRPRK